MNETFRKVNSKRQLEEVIRDNFRPVLAGVMLGDNRSLANINQSMEKTVRNQVQKMGQAPTKRKPVQINVESEKNIREFFEKVWKTPQSEPTQDSSPAEEWQVELLIDMFKRHRWTLDHFEQMRQAGKNSQERFELARTIHENDIAPGHLEQAQKHRIALGELVRHVASGKSPESLFAITGVQDAQRRKKPPKPPKPDPDSGKKTRKVTITEPLLIKALTNARIDSSRHMSVPEAKAEHFRASGISEQKIPLAYTVQQMHEQIHGHAMPQTDLNHWIQQGLHDPYQILFLHHVQRESGEKNEVVWHTLQRKANKQSLSKRGQKVMEKAEELSAILYRKDVLGRLLQLQRTR